MTPEQDLAHCREAIKHGSRSFYAASKLLPPQTRDAALALYAFCRLADDAVDLTEAKRKAVASLRTRLGRAYAGRPHNDPVERAFTRMIEDTDMPRALPEALIEGLDWDAEGRRYETLSGVRDYSARVAAAVGVMMSVLMGVRDRDALARATDLGVAMQLTNIARDVGEDARAGRLYLPLEWLAEAKLEPENFLADPMPGPKVAHMVRRLLTEADRLYTRAQVGIVTLPRACRPGIFAARYIYARIGRHIAAADYDSVSRRARTGNSEKVGLIMAALGAAAISSVMPRSAVLHAPPLEETAFLVDAATANQRQAAPWGEGRTGALVSVLAQLKARDLARQQMLDDSAPSPT